MSPVPITITRDLLHFRKLPAAQRAVSTLASNFFTLLASPDNPAAAVVRSAFLPALLASDFRPRDATQAGALDEQLRALFSSPPNVVVIQGLVTPEQVSVAWSKGTIAESIFLPFALNSEVEQAKQDGEREEEANLNMMILATLTYELAHWIFAKIHGYHESQAAANDMASISSFGANTSVVSLQSLLVTPGSSLDCGVRAVNSLYGYTYELLTYAIGQRQLVKRRTGTRRTPHLTPPLVYQLIGDTPAILDITSQPPTHARWIVPWKENDPMYSVVSALTPFSSIEYHGVCRIGTGEEAPSEYSVSLRGTVEGEEGKF